MSKFHRQAGRCRSPGGLHRWGLAAASPRMGRTAGWSLPVPGWAIPLGPPGGPHRSAGRCRSPGGSHRSAGRCRSPDGPHRRLVAAGPRVGATALSPEWAAPLCWSLPLLGWAAPPGWPLPVPGGPHRSAGRCRSPDGSHRRLVVAGPRLGYSARYPG